MTDVRKLFSANKRDKEKEKARRIEGKFVRYDSQSRLWCTSCNVQIKHESLWNSHLTSKGHRDILKTPVPSVSSKLPAGSKSARNAALVAYSDGVDDESETKSVSNGNVTSSSLPPGFFDSKAESSREDKVSGTSTDSPVAGWKSNLPKGFFDTSPLSTSPSLVKQFNSAPATSVPSSKPHSTPSTKQTPPAAALPGNPALPDDFFQGSAALAAKQAREAYLAAELARFTSEIRTEESKTDALQERDEEEMLGQRDDGLDVEQRAMVARLEELKRKRMGVDDALQRMSRRGENQFDESMDPDTVEDEDTLTTVDTSAVRSALFLPGPADHTLWVDDEDLTSEASIKKRKVTAVVAGKLDGKKKSKKAPAKVLKSIFDDEEEED
ncbi:hypothetical protein HDU93_002203 [Gonapodya sp. JEL0774]|nr:hypothetical protein HDU93_002203 [Gonapodya sp. JEL0774]